MNVETIDHEINRHMKISDCGITWEGDINEMKEWVDEINEAFNGEDKRTSGMGDLFWAIEMAYQRFHNLDEDNLSQVHEPDHQQGEPNFDLIVDRSKRATDFPPNEER